MLIDSEKLKAKLYEWKARIDLVIEEGSCYYSDLGISTGYYNCIVLIEEVENAKDFQQSAESLGEVKNYEQS